MVELPPSAQPPPGHPPLPAGFNSSPCPPSSQRPFVCSCVSLTAVPSHRGRNRRRLQVPAAHLLTSSHLAPHPRPPPGFHAGCRVVTVVFRQDGVPPPPLLQQASAQTLTFPAFRGKPRHRSADEAPVAVEIHRLAEVGGNGVQVLHYCT